MSNGVRSNGGVLLSKDLGIVRIIQTDRADQAVKVQVSGTRFLVLVTRKQPSHRAANGGKCGLVKSGVRSAIFCSTTNRKLGYLIVTWVIPGSAAIKHTIYI